MSRAELITMMRRHMAHSAAGTADQATGVGRVPADHYTDPLRYEQELDAIFKRVPLVLAFSCELNETGSYRAMDVAGTPILLTRDATGAVNGFINMCSHRGAIVVEEGSGKARRFMCPYHAWTYDEKGQLVSILDESEFGEVDRSCLGLTPIAVAERAGIIFGIVSPQYELDIDAWLCGYGSMLEHLRLDECHLVGRQSIAGPNWKIAYDGYLDFYHLPILHRNSFGPDMPNKAVYDAWGPHQRVSMPIPGMERMNDMPEDEWPMEALAAGIWTIFPHISIASFDAGGPLLLISQLFPGENVGESVTVQNFLTPFEPDDVQREKIDQQMELLERVVRDEDYYTGNRIQRALETGAKSEVLFGRNEGGGQRFHAWVDALIETPDNELPALLESKVGPEVA